MRHTTEAPEDHAPGPRPAPRHAPRQGGRPGGQPPGSAEPRGCLFALSQPPLMLFLAVVGGLVFLAAVHDLFLL
ncbi:hypothetical protein [Streptomyces sp. DH37]|uniref:hypothetical protein n=1 Tax=Streptomyces sp. DH37 TaxID=3040122 RepID=UPI002441FB81|nr:hypothetical protein [Streptomyces sp. DH37]MDG9706127.1 hypothetical protein [Streptomyces sp. DH37]